ncbi:MAG: hypothetical protein IJ859_11245 [Synergistaceae bacterium]|nr:hypothetical protein [Synergistaceae bacterium]
MTKKFKNRRLSFLFLSLTLVIFFAIVSGGCGVHHYPISTNNIENNPAEDNPMGDNDNPTENNSQSAAFDEDTDSDGDGVPDVLDFDDTEQKYYGENDSLQDIKISSIPSRHYLKKVANNTSFDASFTADLTAGTEYTIEISESAGISGSTEVADYAYPIGDNVPDVEILNPDGTALKFLDLGTYDENYDVDEVIDLYSDVIELSYYPSDNPYMICYTFTPSVTGSYTINFSKTALADVDVALAEDEADFERVPTLFIYEELRDGTDRNEAGHYKRYTFKDEDGNTSETVSMNDVMALRKAYNNVVYDILSATEEIDQVTAYLECLGRLKKYYGIFDTSDIDIGGKHEVLEVGGTSIINENDPEESEDDVDITATASNAVSLAANTGTQIKQQLFGIPYQDDFQPGVGYFALTGAQAATNAVRSFTLNVPAQKKVKTNYTATFVSSQEDREKLSTTTTGASVSIGGFGLNAGYSSKSSFKFGLTSTTYVIHYEEVENEYRTLKDDEYELKNRPKKILSADIGQFRNRYGDYFVAGYKYGGTYDAFITITTKTMEQLDEVKTTLSANFKTAASAKVENTTKETLTRNDARVSIEIKTAGIDVSQLKIPTTTTDISEVPRTLNAFMDALKTTTADSFQPVYVMMKRYSLLDDVDEAMEKQNDRGLVPISPTHATKILAFNREKLTMDAYYNVISDLESGQIDTAVKSKYASEYDNIVNTIGTNPDFYLESNSAQMDELKNKMANLGTRLKAIGDRYTFYQYLMAAQRKEESCASESDITKRPFGLNGGYVGKDSFAVSTAVTSDIAAGSEKSDFRNQYSGKSWEPTFDAGSGCVFCYVNVTANNTHDVTRTADLYCIGKSSASFHFTCGAGRWLEWKVSLRSMRFNSTLYPFNGLK